MNKLPDKLLRLRKHYGYSQSYIADILDIDTLRYMHYENGNSMPSYSEIKALSRLYKIPFKTLFVNEEDVDLSDRRFDVDRQNYHFLRGQAKKDRYRAFWSKNKFFIITIPLLAVLLGVFLFLLNREDEGLMLVIDPQTGDTLAASDTTVVYIGTDKKAYGKGDNTYSQLDFDLDDVVDIDEGINFTVALLSDGTIAQSGLVKSVAAKIDELHSIVKIEAGNSHIVALDSKGTVTCIGSNELGQCDADGLKDVVDIFADDNATVVKKSDGSIEGYGSFLGKDELDKLDGLIDMDISTKVSAFVDDTGHVTYFSDGTRFDGSLLFKNVIEVACGDDFIAALDSDGKVSIDIAENNKITEEVSSWENVRSIAAGSDYLVALIEDEIKGVGNNTYDQFEVEQSQMLTLAQVSNVRVVYDDTDLIITFDSVAHATSYQLTIDAGIGIAVNENTTEFRIPLDRFSDGEEYTIQIVAIGDDRYENSAPNIINYRYYERPKEVPEDEDIPFTLDKLTGKSRSALESYLESFGVDSANIQPVENPSIICDGEEEVIAIEGIEDYETLTLKDLLERKITYYYCKVVE